MGSYMFRASRAACTWMERMRGREDLSRRVVGTLVGSYLISTIATWDFCATVAFDAT